MTGSGSGDDPVPDPIKGTALANASEKWKGSENGINRRNASARENGSARGRKRGPDRRQHKIRTRGSGLAKAPGFMKSVKIEYLHVSTNFVHIR